MAHETIIILCNNRIEVDTVVKHLLATKKTDLTPVIFKRNDSDCVELDQNSFCLVTSDKASKSIRNKISFKSWSLLTGVEANYMCEFALNDDIYIRINNDGVGVELKKERLVFMLKPQEAYKIAYHMRQLEEQLLLSKSK